MKIFKIVLQIALIGQFAYFGASKVVGTAEMVATFTAFGYPSWFMVLTGLIELTAVACLLYGFVNRRAVYAGALLLIGLTIGATFSHAVIEGSLANAIPPVIVLAQTLLMAWLHSRVMVKKSDHQLALAA